MSVNFYHEGNRLDEIQVEISNFQDQTFDYLIYKYIYLHGLARRTHNVINSCIQLKDNSRRHHPFQ